MIPIDKTEIEYSGRATTKSDSREWWKYRRGGSKETVRKNAEDLGEEKLSEQLRNFFENVKTRKNSDENLNSQHKNGFNSYNNCTFVNIVMEYTNETRQKSERWNGVKENKAIKAKEAAVGHW